MRAVVVGSGAREHALALALGKSVDVVATPGNPGISGVTPEGHTIASVGTPAEELVADLFVIGPEAPLVDGLADRLRARGQLVFGPGADGARLEGSKTFMKQLANSASVPTAAFGVFEDQGSAECFLATLPGRYVVKADGLAAGKGVLVTSDLDEARRDVASKLSGEAFGDAGRRVVIEEGLEGPELSLLVLTDGTRAAPLPAAQDFKRLGDGDAGPNTGGMGAYSPVPVATDAVIDKIMDEIVEPSLTALRRLGVDYRGVLYAGCMLTASGPKLIEFNVRFGDPETEVVLARVTDDLFALLAAAAAGELRRPVSLSDDASVCVVAASEGYPGSPVTGAEIHGLEAAGSVRGVSVLHAGTMRDLDGKIRVSGGRVLGVRAVAPTLGEARDRAYLAMSEISFDGMQVRSDIALEAAAGHDLGRVLR
ncbi:MAG TPA: phosphoribosylamine--glycine ligase [Acidimicrobiales bacterium]